MTLKEEERKVLIKHKLAKAKELLGEVLFLIEHEKFSTAVNRIYYGMFYSVSALALKNGFQTVKHQQLIGWFNKTFIKDGSLDSRYGKMLINAYDKRSKGDYEDFVEFSEEEVMQMYENMRDFIDEISNLINSK